MILLLSWLTGAAQAQQACISTYSRIQLGVALGQVADALEDGMIPEAKAGATDISDHLPCLDEVIDRTLFAKFARDLAIVYFFGQEEELAVRWAQASRLADPALEWDPVRFPEDHPLRRMIADAGTPARGGPALKGLAVPKGGGVFQNGSFLAEPLAYAELPALVQVFDKDQRLVEAYWQDGTAFPPRLLTDQEQVLTPPAWWGDGAPTRAVASARPPKSPKPAPGPRPEPVRSGDGVPVLPIAASTGLVLISGATYLLASSAAASLPDQRTGPDLTSVRTRANAWVLVSGVSLAGAVGVGVGGVLVHADGVRFSGRF